MVLSGIKQDRTKGQTNYIQLAVAVSQKIWTAGEKLETYVEMQCKIKQEDSKEAGFKRFAGLHDHPVSIPFLDKVHERHSDTVIQRIITIYSIILKKKTFSHLPSYVVSLREVDYNCPFKSLKSNSCETACRLKRTRCMLYWG